MRTLIFTTLVTILSFTSWWMYELGKYPFIYLYPVPETVEERFNQDWSGYLEYEQISEISFGDKPLKSLRMMPASLTVGNVSRDFEVENLMLGVIHIEKVDSRYKVYWRQYKEVDDITARAELNVAVTSLLPK
ncbi:hypothetical protein [uncultured Umboniibacter sp.]|uniref:hypothetical protein n=1 Tax=uncultured Umboniibacter sp. TaxID=1798917 RepID=UPI002631FA40|nr:hypothetical protein [uncultured Umboniibacter sp.]